MTEQDFGRSPDGSGYSAEPEPSCTVSAVPVSIPNATREQRMERIGDELWTRTKEDWFLSLSHDLTEPTCPTATIKCQRKEAGWQYWRADADTIDEAIDRVLGLAWAALIEGSDAIGVPWSEPSLKPVPQETPQ